LCLRGRTDRLRNDGASPFGSESQAASFIRARIAKGTTVHADESNALDGLHERFEMKRINHQEAYSFDGACTNQAEEYFSRLRRAEIGIHHHIAGAYLLRYAQESSWREDSRSGWKALPAPYVVKRYPWCAQRVEEAQNELREIYSLKGRWPMTVWFYTNTNKPEGDVERLKVFASADAANEWFKFHDPEGVASHTRWWPVTIQLRASSFWRPADLSLSDVMTEHSKTLAEIQEDCRRFAAEIGDTTLALILYRAAHDLEQYVRNDRTLN
jgi:hypothetical protein